MNRSQALWGFVLLLLVSGCDNDQKLGIFNAVPTVAITSHQDGDTVMAGEQVLLIGNVSDADHASDSLEVTWTVGGLHTCTDATSDDSGLTSCTAVIVEGTGEIVLQAKDPGNEVGQASITLKVIPNEAPAVVIIAPQPEDAPFYSGQLISFEGLVSDPEDDPEALVVSWTSSVDGDLALSATPDSSGTVADATALSEGQHLLTLTAADPAGKTGTDTVTIEVGPANTAPSCSITAPVTGTAVEEGTLIQFEGLVADPDIGANQLTVEWSSDKDGALGSSTASSAGDVVFPFSGLSADTHVVTLIVTDEVGGSCADFVTVTVGSAPSVTLLLPASGVTFKLGDPVTFSAEVSDQEDSPTDLELEWSSSIDGVFSSQGAASSGVADFMDSTLSEGTHTVTVTVTDSTGFDAEDYVSFIVAANLNAPSITSVSIDPQPAYVTDTLTCNYSGYSDADGDPDQSTIEWTVGGSVVGTGATLSGAFVKGDKATCTVTPFDGSLSGTSLSANRTIKNSPPSISSVTISPSAPGPGDTLSCSYAGFFDADGDTDTSTGEWVVNTSSAGNSATLSGVFGGGDTVTCSVTPDDGSDTGSAVSDTVTIGNTAPSVSDVTILATTDADGDGDSSTAIAADTLECSYTFTDADGDSDASSIEWTISGTGGGSGSGSTLSGVFYSGDTVTCTVTPDDGTDVGATDSDSLTIDNSLPEVSSVTITPDPAYIGDSLSCSYSFTDGDGDPDASSIEWFLNNASAGAGSTLSSSVVKGDEVECTVTPNDSSDDGTLVTASLTVSNSLPSVASVSISPSAPGVGDTLTCSYSGYGDADGDPDASTFEWSVYSASVGSASVGSGTSLSGAFGGGDTVVCSVTPHDGEDAGSPVSDSVTIDNTAPTVSAVVVTASTDADGDGDPSTANAADTLLCSYTFADADGDSDASTIEWMISTPVGTGATLTGAFAKGDTVTCTVTANDGNLDGNLDSASITIDNALPVASAVSVTASTDMDGDGDPSTAIDSDELLCIYSFDDADGDADASTLEWTIGATVIDSGSTTEPPGYSNGDTVTCTVTPTDALGSGTPVSDSITIGTTAASVCIGDFPEDFSNDLASISHCSSITGHVHVVNTTLVDLTGLENLLDIGKDLLIEDNASLTSLTGLDNLTEVGDGLFVTNNDVLPSLTGLGGLTNVGEGMTINGNLGLLDLSGLDSLTTVDEDVLLFNNNGLLSLAGIESLTLIGGTVFIQNNSVLEDVDGFAGVTSISDDLYFDGNGALTDLFGFEGLLTIGGSLTFDDNDDLANLWALHNLTAVGGDLYIGNNALLIGVDGLSGVTGLTGTLTIKNNPALEDVDGLDGLVSVDGDLFITNNDALADVDGLEVLSSVGGDLSVTGNKLLLDLDGLDQLSTIGGALNVWSNAALSSLDGLYGLTSVQGWSQIWGNDICKSDMDAFIAFFAGVGPASSGFTYDNWGC
jgi:hypothetical protein